MNQKARDATKQYHQKIYIQHRLFKHGSWLEKPEPEINLLAKKLSNLHHIDILDLGSGVGRNSIPLAQVLSENHPYIICVDYLDVAIRKLRHYAKQYNVEQFIEPQLSEVERYEIQKDAFDLIIAHGILAYLESRKIINEVLHNVVDGTRSKGYIYLSINTNVKEHDMVTRKRIEPTIGVDLASNETISLLRRLYRGWKIIILKKTPYKETYEKDGTTVQYSCDFVSLIAQKP